VFPVPRAMLGGGGKAAIELRYPQGGNTTRWTVLERPASPAGAGAGTSAAMPLTAMGPIHADQNVAGVRYGRNVVGSRLRIGEESFDLGIGCFAQSLLEYALDGRYKRFTATVGVDAAAEGRGSVVFEMYADGKKVWSSPLMSGLDAARKVDVPLAGVKRLRLVVTDGGDGNRYDAADWCDAKVEAEE
jgi:hypothetical protein